MRAQEAQRKRAVGHITPGAARDLAFSVLAGARARACTSAHSIAHIPLRVVRRVTVDEVGKIETRAARAGDGREGRDRVDVELVVVLVLERAEGVFVRRVLAPRRVRRVPAEDRVDVGDEVDARRVGRVDDALSQ